MSLSIVLHVASLSSMWKVRSRMVVTITKTINILLPNNRVIKVESPELSEEEFQYFIKIMLLQKYGLIIPNLEQLESEE